MNDNTLFDHPPLYIYNHHPISLTCTWQKMFLEFCIELFITSSATPISLRVLLSVTRLIMHHEEFPKS